MQFSLSTGVIRNVFKKMINSCYAIPRLEVIAIPDMEGEDLVLHSTDCKEDYVKNILAEVEQIVERNMPGPIEYLKVYDKFLFIVNGKAEDELQEILNPKNAKKIDSFEIMGDPEAARAKREQLELKLEDFDGMMDSYARYKYQICGLKEAIPLNLFKICTDSFNDTMSNVLDGYRLKITDHFLNDVRNQTLKLLQEFEDMKSRISEIPDTTAEVVAMINYIHECRDTILDEMEEQIYKIGTCSLSADTFFSDTYMLGYVKTLDSKIMKVIVTPLKKQKFLAHYEKNITKGSLIREADNYINSELNFLLFFSQEKKFCFSLRKPNSQRKTSKTTAKFSVGSTRSPISSTRHCERS